MSFGSYVLEINPCFASYDDLQFFQPSVWPSAALFHPLNHSLHRLIASPERFPSKPLLTHRRATRRPTKKTTTSPLTRPTSTMPLSGATRAISPQRTCSMGKAAGRDNLLRPSSFSPRT